MKRRFLGISKLKQVCLVFKFKTLIIKVEPFWFLRIEFKYGNPWLSLDRSLTKLICIEEIVIIIEICPIETVLFCVQILIQFILIIYALVTNCIVTIIRNFLAWDHRYCHAGLIVRLEEVFLFIQIQAQERVFNIDLIWAFYLFEIAFRCSVRLIELSPLGFSTAV